MPTAPGSRAPKSPPIAARYGTGAQLSELTAERTAELIRTAAAERGRGHRRPQDRRLLRQLHGRGGHREQGRRPAAARTEGASTPSRAVPRWRAASAPRCVRTWTSSTTPTCTPRTCSVCGSRRISTTRRATRPSCCRAAWGCPTATTTSIRRRRWPTIRTQYQAHIAAVLELAHLPRRARAGRARVRARAPHGRGAHLARRLRGRAQGRQPLDPQGLRDAGRPGLDWTGVLRRRRTRQAARVRRLAAGRGQRPVAHSPPASRSKCGRTTCAST